MCLLVFFFFFSSRRRHTRLQGDWSSDVCSSDLPPGASRRYKLRDDLGDLPPCKSWGNGNPVTGKNLFLFVGGELVSPVGRAFNQPPRVGTMEGHKTVRGCNGRGQTCGATQ